MNLYVRTMVSKSIYDQAISFVEGVSLLYCCLGW